MVFDAEKYLFSIETKGIKLGLARTHELLKRCGSPHKDISIIQVLGTNGKGSTSAILHKLLNLQYNVGLYTSPHLYSFRERIRYNGLSIPLKEVELFLSKYQKTINSLNASFFETMTVMAVWYFRKKEVDYAIMETGLGGKFDSVTACQAKTYAITSISMDHEHILGDTIELIAKEKIAAISNQSVVYSAPQKHEVERLIVQQCKINKSHLFKISINDNLKLSLKGKHQIENGSLALEIARKLLVNWNEGSINKCLMSINWHGRNQILSTHPTVIFDVGHNEEGINSFLEYINTQKTKKYSKKTLLFSVQKNKNISKIAQKLESSFDKIIYSQTSPKYSMSFTSIKQCFQSVKNIQSPSEALKMTINNAKKDELIAIVGTHYWGASVKSFFNICFDNI
mgnify:CR=1 FL=1